MSILPVDLIVLANQTVQPVDEHKAFLNKIGDLLSKESSKDLTDLVATCPDLNHYTPTVLSDFLGIWYWNRERISGYETGPHSITPLHAILLHKGCWTTETEIKRCIELGANVSLPILDKMGKPLDNPLTLAIRNCKFDVIKAIVDGGADVNSLDRTGLSALQLACSLKKDFSVPYLIEKGATVTPENAKAVFESSLRIGNLELAKMALSLLPEKFLETHVDEPLKFYELTYTRLHRAALHGFVEIGKFLLDAGADINATRIYTHGTGSERWNNEYDETALHISLIYEHFDFAKMLIERGADVSKPTYRHEHDAKREGRSVARTALHIAEAAGNQEIIDLIIQQVLAKIKL